MSDLYLSSGFNPRGAGKALEMFRKDDPHGAAQPVSAISQGQTALRVF